jgi:hypothetical protein
VKGDRKKMAFAATLALFFLAAGFILFLKPQLGQQTGPHTPDLKTQAAAASAFPNWTPDQMVTDLTKRAQSAGLDLKVTPNDVKQASSSLTTTLPLQGSATSVFGFLDLVGESLRLESGQLRCLAPSAVGGDSCPLYVISALTLNEQAGSLSGSVTISLATKTTGLAPAAPTP